MKKIFLTFMFLLLVVSFGKKEPSYPIYTRDEKKLMYKEAKDNENQEKEQMNGRKLCIVLDLDSF